MTQIIDTYELSPMQAGMLFHAVSGVDRGVDVEQVVATLHETLEEARFLRAWHGWWSGTRFYAADFAGKESRNPCKTWSI
jgi:hypothetical protein